MMVGDNAFKSSSYKIDPDKKRAYMDKLQEEDANEGVKNTVANGLKNLDIYEQEIEKSIFDMNNEEIDGLFYNYPGSSPKTLRMFYNVIKKYVEAMVSDDFRYTPQCLVFFAQPMSVETINKYINYDRMLDRYLTKYEYQEIITNDEYPLFERSAMILAWNGCMDIIDHVDSFLKKDVSMAENVIKLSPKKYDWVEEEKIYEFTDLEMSILRANANAVKDSCIIEGEILPPTILDASDWFFRRNADTQAKRIRKQIYGGENDYIPYKTKSSFHLRRAEFVKYIGKRELTWERIKKSKAYNDMIDEYGYDYNYGKSNPTIKEKYGISLAAKGEEGIINGIIEERKKYEMSDLH